MKKLIIKQQKTDALLKIKNCLIKNKGLTKKDIKILIDFIDSFLDLESLNDTLLSLKAKESPISDYPYELIEGWLDLFQKIPGFNETPIGFQVTESNRPDLCRKNVVAFCLFSPSFTYEKIHQNIEVHLMVNLEARFDLLHLKGDKNLSHLEKFKGSWNEAYLLMIETMEKGWPLKNWPKPKIKL